MDGRFGGSRDFYNILPYLEIKFVTDLTVYGFKNDYSLEGEWLWNKDQQPFGRTRLSFKSSSVKPESMDFLPF